MDLIILSMAGIYFLSHLFAAAFERTRIPDVLPLILIGALLGPVSGLVVIEDFGQVGEVFTTYVLIVILFEGGLHINLHRTGKTLGTALAITTLSFLMTIGIAAAISQFVLELDPVVALMLGATVAGTSASVLIPLARSLGIPGTANTLISFESSLTDVLVIVCVLGFIGAAQSGNFEIVGVLSEILSMLGMGIVIGALGGLLWLSVLNSVRAFPNTTLTTLGFALLVFGVAEILGFNGAISVFFFGMTVDNYSLLGSLKLDFLAKRQLGELDETERSIHQEIVFIFKTFFFVYLGISLRMAPSEYYFYAFVLVTIVYLLRGVLVRLLLPRDVYWKDAAFVSIFAAKGLAAAAVAGLPLAIGIAGGNRVLAFTHAVILVSIGMTTLGVLAAEVGPARHVFRYFFRFFAPSRGDSSDGLRPPNVALKV